MSVADILSPAVQLGVNKKQRMASMPQLGVNGDESVEEDTNVSDPEEDSRQFISILIKCLALLNKIPEAVDTIKERCDKELTNLAKRTGREVSGDSTDTGVTTDWTGDKTFSFVLSSSALLGNYNSKQKAPPHSLQNFLDLLFQQYRTVVHLHESIVLAALQRLEYDQSVDIDGVTLYTIPDIWSKVQTIVQYVMDLYLDTSGAHSSAKANPAINPSVVSANPTVADLSSYFVRKSRITALTTDRLLKTNKAPLFRFDHSSHAISLNAYLAEQKEAALKEMVANGESGGDTGDGHGMDSIDFTLNSTEKYIVCVPQPENIVLMFNPLIKFIREVEDELELDDGSHCPLYLYLISCAKSFCNQINHDLERTIDLANKSLDIWKIQTDPEWLAGVGLSR
ncbi:unnamed protein product, partial [Medioppia subpectinata]